MQEIVQGKILEIHDDGGVVIGAVLPSLERAVVRKYATVEVIGTKMTLGIAQILKDFRNTIKAISTPADIEEEVNRYLQIVEQQVREPKPQVNLIQSNLKIAASLLDRYISDTLNKDSKVVQNWLDALFLQRINYNYNADEINPSFLVRFPEETPK